MTPEPVTALVTGLAGVAAGGFVPTLIARVPEPELGEPEEPDKGEDDTTPLDEGPPEEPKEAYAAIAARPGLAWQAAVASGVAAAAIGLVTGWDADLVVLLPLVPVGVALAVIDWRTRLLPTRLIAPAYAVTLVAVVVAFFASGADVGDLERTGLGWLAYGGGFFLLWFIYPSGLGYGDVRLAGVLGLALGWVGWAELVVAIWAGVLLGGLLGGLLSVVRRRRDYPFGPFMLLGALLGVVLGQPVLDALYG
ncbi:prepilin peptidase [Nocardioides anomalus]|uniref:Prepilin peptidase n=1 Tax=Nocardioides anomalus TaxID=2712223 RepID=A0A6G6WDU3_9ACTN|nr:A24 family peptidase [Nocardioides anomalus]QIG43498.1 prepilin peptidase [Nocardioides anomalus]